MLDSRPRLVVIVVVATGQTDRVPVVTLF